MLDTSTHAAILSILWIGVVIVVVRLCQRRDRPSLGLPAAFVFATTFLYSGIFVYAVPGYTTLRLDALPALSRYGVSEGTVIAGSWITLLGLVGFAIGVWLAAPRAPPTVEAPRAVDAPDDRRHFAIFGALTVIGFLLPALGATFPLAQALGQVGQNLGIVVVCLGGASARARSDRRTEAFWLLAALAIPVWYAVVWGFLSYGFVAATVIGAFGLTTTRARRWSTGRLTAAVLATGYLCLSVFVAYMSARDDIRAVIWNGGDLSERVAVFGTALSNTKLLSPFDFTSLDLLSLRLNQANFVGAVVEWHDRFPDLRTYGGSLLLSLLAPVPRALWPGKPEMGTNTMLELNSGLRFSEDATFGAGPVIEFYANFGTVGVFVGFLVLGMVLARLDARAAMALRAGRVVDCVRPFTVGVALVAPLTDVFFLVSTSVATWLVLKAVDLVCLYCPIPKRHLVRDRLATPAAFLSLCRITDEVVRNCLIKRADTLLTRTPLGRSVLGRWK